MKVKVENEMAASLFGCAIGEYRDLQRRDAKALLATGAVSEVQDVLSTEDPLDKMTVEELKAVAAAKGIDLGGAKRKAEIRAAIDAALQAAA